MKTHKRFGIRRIIIIQKWRSYTNTHALIDTLKLDEFKMKISQTSTNLLPRERRALIQCLPHIRMTFWSLPLSIADLLLLLTSTRGNLTSPHVALDDRQDDAGDDADSDQDKDVYKYGVTVEYSTSHIREAQTGGFIATDLETLGLTFSFDDVVKVGGVLENYSFVKNPVVFELF